MDENRWRYIKRQLSPIDNEYPSISIITKNTVLANRDAKLTENSNYTGSWYYAKKSLWDIFSYGGGGGYTKTNIVITAAILHLDLSAGFPPMNIHMMSFREPQSMVPPSAHS